MIFSWNMTIYDDALWDEAWAYVYVYLSHQNKPISDWLKTQAESEYTYIGDNVRILEIGIRRGRLNMDQLITKITKMRGAKRYLKYYGKD